MYILMYQSEYVGGIIMTQHFTCKILKFAFNFNISGFIKFKVKCKGEISFN